MNKSNSRLEILYENEAGSVALMDSRKNLKVFYGNLILEQSIHEFNHLQSMIDSLNLYIKDVRQVYYRRFFVRWKKYGALALNSKEVKELCDLLGGAKLILELDHIIHDTLNKK